MVCAATTGAGRAGAAAGRGHVAALDARLERVLTETAPSQRVLAWVYFVDKGPAGTPTTPAVSARSLVRRAKVTPHAANLEFADRPLYERYVERVARRVGGIRQRSRWFNAVSVEATPMQIAAVRGLPEVRELALVARFRRTPAEVRQMPQFEPPPAKPSAAAPRSPSGALDYGLSSPQVQMLRVPELHDRGLSGRGVLIGHFDDGHRLLSHQSLASLHIVAGRDFVDHDGNPAPPPDAPDFYGAHGISTLSVLAGFAPGQLIGPAYGADFALARTENDASETPFEEDNWVAAAEWADSLGCDVVSSSVGYLDYDTPYRSWTWQDMDGNATVITRAADMAVARGIVVVAAAGNGGFPTGGRGNTLNAPADGDSVLAAGGVWIPPGGTEPVRWGSSSMGPTANQPPRIKPDLAAPGAAVYMAGAGSTTQFGYNSGTSFACPLVAGVVALLLEAQPGATPMQIRDALRSTANHASSPNNEVGWGVVDGVRALAALQTPVVPRTFSEIKRLYRDRQR